LGGRGGSGSLGRYRRGKEGGTSQRGGRRVAETWGATDLAVGRKKGGKSEERAKVCEFRSKGVSQAFKEKVLPRINARYS